jgi:AcrR family transcriptional regulator
VVSVERDTRDDEVRVEKPLRADAQRNRDKLIEAARGCFRERGSDASLDEIAKRAGVGPGTLYRHFPTRDDLIDAMMRDWAERIESDARSVIEAGASPRATLTEWFSRFIDNVGIYQGAAHKMMSAMEDPASPIYRKCQVLVQANRSVLESEPVREGVRADVDARLFMWLVSGVSVAVDQSGLTAEEAKPMLQIIIDGVLRPDAD